MFYDIFISTVASLLAGIITGYLGQKAIKKHDTIILQVFVIFVSVVVFLTTAIVCLLLNEAFLSRLSKISEVNLLRFYSNSINSLVFITGMVTCVALFIICIEAYNRSEKREHKNEIDWMKMWK